MQRVPLNGLSSYKRKKIREEGKEFCSRCANSHGCVQFMNEGWWFHCYTAPDEEGRMLQQRCPNFHDVQARSLFHREHEIPDEDYRIVA